jgi:hypothetical protein
VGNYPRSRSQKILAIWPVEGSHDKSAGT